MSELITHVPIDPKDPLLQGARYQYEEQVAQVQDYDPDATIPREQLDALVHTTAETYQHDNHTVTDDDPVAQATEAMRAKVERGSDQESQNTFELLTYFPPNEGVTLGDKQIYLSPVFGTERGRKHAVGYTTLPDGTVAPRLFYKSMSDGFWRVSPTMEKVEEDGRTKLYYDKGNTLSHGYARETRLKDELSGALEAAEADKLIYDKGQIDWMLDHFVPEKLGDADTYDVEADGTVLKGIGNAFIYKPGQGFISEDDPRPAREVLQDIQLDPGRVPQFAAGPVRTTVRKHELLGDVTVETYRSADGLVEWNMASAKDGSVWVNGITNPHDVEATSYGTDADVITAGVFDNKPIEYRSQVQGLEEGVDYEPFEGSKLYVKLKVLDNLPLIQAYREAKGISRIQPAVG